ncbi:YheC/YheD family protein [Paenibacillus senegalensis]|uniref:YheC/YheD family protein n=1 Tax=Paenibacillus senegalensis TaxID=1465766 RepID=UPI0002896C51|nr:YheC/YheD family protein [Paenibacillus senegalensis]
MNSFKQMKPLRMRSKLKKTRILLKQPKIARHIPLTVSFSNGNLQFMLNRYRMVYVKPDQGAMGVGVMRVEKHQGGYQYQYGTRVYRYSSLSALCLALRDRMKGRRYLIQKGIRLLRYRQRPFDLRLMVQKNPARKWEPTGMFGRVAHPRKAVTNGSQGGSIYCASRLIRSYAGKEQTRRLIKQMKHIALLTAHQLGGVNRTLNELGLDIALDRKLKPWILEVNTRPDICPFTLLKDKSPLRKIIAYGRWNGRRYRLTCKKARRGN